MLIIKMQMKHPCVCLLGYQGKCGKYCVIEITTPCELIALKYIMKLWKNTNMYTYVLDTAHSQQTPKCMIYSKAKDPKLI